MRLQHKKCQQLKTHPHCTITHISPQDIKHSVTASFFLLGPGALQSVSAGKPSSCQPCVQPRASAQTVYVCVRAADCRAIGPEANLLHQDNLTAAQVSLSIHTNVLQEMCPEKAPCAYGGSTLCAGSNVCCTPTHAAARRQEAFFQVTNIKASRRVAQSKVCSNLGPRATLSCRSKPTLRQSACTQPRMLSAPAVAGMAKCVCLSAHTPCRRRPGPCPDACVGNKQEEFLPSHAQCVPGDALILYNCTRKHEQLALHVGHHTGPVQHAGKSSRHAVG